MAIDLSKAFGSFESKDVVVRGQTIHVRALPATATLAIENQMPIPKPPPGVVDPGAAANLKAINAERRALMVAAACDFTGEDGRTWGPNMSNHEAKRLAVLVLQRLTEREIYELWQTVDDFGRVLPPGSEETLIGSEAAAGN